MKRELFTYDVVTSKRRNNMSFQCTKLNGSSKIIRPRTSLNNSVFYPNYYGEDLGLRFSVLSKRSIINHIPRFTTISTSERVSDLFNNTSQNIKSPKRFLLEGKCVKSNKKEIKERLSSIIKWISRRHYVAIKRPVSKCEVITQPLSTMKLNKPIKKPKNPYNFSFIQSMKCKGNIENVKKVPKKYKIMPKQSKTDIVNKIRINGATKSKRSIVRLNQDLDGDEYNVFQQVYK